MQIVIQGKIKKVSERLGEALIKMGRAERITETEPEVIRKDVVAEVDKEPQPKKRGRPRKYQRRDLTPED